MSGDLNGLGALDLIGYKNDEKGEGLLDDKFKSALKPKNLAESFMPSSAKELTAQQMRGGSHFSSINAGLSAH